MYVLTSVSAFLATDMDEPHIIDCQKNAQTTPLVLSASFILYFMENISSDEDWQPEINGEKAEYDSD